MAAVLYLLGLISIVLGAIVAADQFIDTYSLGLSLSVAYQAVVGGILLFVMARLLQHAAATARNTEKFYQQVLQNPGAATALVAAAPAATAAATPAAPAVAAAAAVEPAATPPANAAPAAEAPASEDAAPKPPKLETPAKPEPEPVKPAEAEAAPKAAEQPAEEASAPAVEEAKEEATSAPEAPSVDTETEPTIVEQLEYRGYMIDKLSDGKVDVHTAEGPMQFESLETFQRELELSNS